MIHAKHSAVRLDDVFKDASTELSSPTKRGRDARQELGLRGAWWKQWLPSAMLRTAFTAINLCARHVARFIPHTSGKKNGGASNHRHVRDVRSTCAQVYIDKQTHLATSSLQSELKWSVYQLQWDETKLHVQTGSTKKSALPPSAFNITRVCPSQCRSFRIMSTTTLSSSTPLRGTICAKTHLG